MLALGAGPPSEGGTRSRAQKTDPDRGAGTGPRNPPGMGPRGGGVSFFTKVVCLVVAAIAVFATQASAAVPHTVLPGETLWAIAAANNFTTDSLAAYNGLSADTQVYTGERIQIPTEAEAAGAVASSTSTAATGSATTSSTTSSTTGVSHTVQPG